ncbi:hypothetical protein [Aliihoeflea sp. 40Bstr573]|uniref:hypothetical protein n=1 Tax=Aliihoeflea sp. 40Bstr573 TaxID=2696467 RepID=UPI0020945B80|nr:hypothetical protein [Aliihoeflea sp. 40Bstr573]MCO6389142.1 hypothetical protein [Aliihoeflea sp. 40Bstr573]
MSRDAARHPNCAMIARLGWHMRIWSVFLLALSACSTFDAGPPPVPEATVAPAALVAPVAPAAPVDRGIRPLTEDQRAMLDG